MEMVKSAKERQYEELLEQATALLGDEERPLPAMANICALLKERFGFFWVGFYILDGEDMTLGPFQGPVACMTIKKGRGVCGASRERMETIVVPDVEQFPGHIACNPLSRSEIVVPVINEDRVVAVLDIDSSQLDTFDDTDAIYLEKLLELPFVKNISMVFGGMT